MKKLFVLMIALLISGISFGQLTGSKTIPGDYTSLALAITDLNTVGVGAGGVTFNIAAGYTETFATPTAGLITATGTSSNPIIFQKSGVGTNPLITAGIGVSTSVDGIIVIRGGDYITFDGIDLQENAANITATTQMEWGYALVKASVTDGSQYNNIKNCAVTLNKLNTVSAGVYLGNHTDLITTQLVITNITGANSFNKINGNTISNAFTPIYINGFADVTPFAFYDQNNEVGFTTANNLGNFGGATTSYAVYLKNNNNAKICNNNIGNLGSTSTLRAVYLAASTNANVDVNNNTINLTSASLTNQLTAIESAITGVATINMNNNNITLNHATATTGTLYGIYNTSACANLSISSNTISATTTGTGGTYLIYNSGAVTNSININNNLINSLTLSAATASQTIGLIYVSGGAATATTNINNNSISGITFSGATGGTGTLSCIYQGAAVSNEIVTGNAFNNLNLKTAGSVYLINNNNSTNNMTISGNAINGTFAKTVAGGTVYGYYNFGSPTGGTATINNNSFSNITLTGATIFYGIDHYTSTTQTMVFSNNFVSNITAGTSAVYGIWQGYGAAGSTVNTNTVSNITGAGAIYGIYLGASAAPVSLTAYSNTVYGLNCTGGTNVYGIYHNLGTSSNIYKNKIYNLNSALAGGRADGITIFGGTTVNVYNNFISDLNTPAATGANSIKGININAGTTIGAYYNTIYLNSPGTGVGFGTSGIYATITPTTVDLKNNIVINTSVPGVGGYTVAYRRSAVGLTNFTNASNNNCLYAGTPSATNLIFYDGTNSSQTIGAYQAFVAPRETVSFSNVPPFVNIATTPYNLHMQTAVATMCESGGVQITVPVITNDFDGDIRWGEIGYAGSGTTTDIGADEFNGLPSYTCAAPSPGNTLSTSTTLCLGQGITLSLQNTTVGTGVSYQWQSSPTGVGYTNIVGATSSTYIVTPSAAIYYQCIVTCNNGPVSATSTPVHITFVNNITGTTPGSRCGAGTVSLAAAGSIGTTLNWYAASSGGVSLGTNSPFITPVIPSTTTYYVSAEISALGSILGAGASTSAGYESPFNHVWGGMKTQYLITAVELTSSGLTAGNINSLSLDVVTPGTTYNTFNLSIGTTVLTAMTTTLQSGLTNVYSAASITPIAGLNTITFSTPFLWDGVSNIIIESCWSNNNTGGATTTIKYDPTSYVSESYYRNDSQTPAVLCGTTTTTGTLSTRPKMIFNYVPSCSSPRSAVIATIGASPVLTITGNQTLCNNVSGTLTVTSTVSDYNSYTWSPVTDLYTDAACTVPYVALGNSSTVYVKSATGGLTTYTCTANNSSTFCSNIATSAVTILPIIDVTASASNNPICAGSPVTLTGSISTGVAGTYTAPPAVTYPTSDEDFGNITFGTLNNTTAINSLVGTIGTASGTPGSYSDFTSFGPYSFVAGNTYPLSISAITSGSAYFNGMGVYIDYNRNGVFTDPGEAVYVSATTTSGAHTETASITIPLTAQLGLTRMRVIDNEGLVTGPTMAVAYGEYEEYTLNITTPGMTFAWSDGVATVGTTNPLTIIPIASHNYTLTATDLNSCIYTSLPVTVNILALPSTPTANNSTQCGTSVPTCSMTSTSGALTPIFNWYTAPTGGTPIIGITGATYTGAAISVATHFYVSEFNGTCESPRVDVFANVTIAPVLTITANQNTCNNLPVSMAVNSTLANYNTYTWSPVTDLYTDIACTVPYVALANANTVYFKSTTVGQVTYTCSSNNSTTFCSNTATSTITVADVVATPTTTNDTVTICQGSVSALIDASIPASGTLVASFGTNLQSPGPATNFVITVPALPAGATITGTQLLITGANSINGSYRSEIQIALSGATTLTTSTISALNSGGLITPDPSITVPNLPIGGGSVTLTLSESFDDGGAGTIDATFNEISLLISYTLPAATINWWNSATAGTLIGTGNSLETVGTSVLLNTNTPGSYHFYADASIGTCSSPARLPLTVIVTQTPTTPTANNSSQCGAAVPVCSVTSTSSTPTPTFNWYLTALGGTPIAGVTGATYTGTAITVATHFYVSEIIGICESPRVDVFANVVTAPALTITADQTVCNNSVATIGVNSTLANFNTYTWSPVTDLYSDVACTIPYVALANATTLYVKSTGATTTYTCNSVNTTTFCTNIATTTVTTIPASQLVSNSGSGFCLSGSSTLTATPNTGYGSATFQWQSSADNITFANIVGATSGTYATGALTNTTYYRILAKIGATTCSTSNVDSIVVNNPQVLSTTPGSRCGTGTVNLSATVSNGSTLNWYAASTGGTSLGTGANFTTPVISTTTNFYAEGSVGGSAYTIGAANTSISASLAGQTTTSSGINFDVLSPSVHINSIDVYPTAAIGSSFTITVKQGATVIASYTGTTTVSGTISAPVVQTVPVNFTIPAGTGYQITLPTNPGIIRNSGGAAFPYVVPGVISLTSSTLSGYYYNFYNWQVSTGCISPRVIVIATVTPAPAITVSANPTIICSGDTTTLSANSSNTSYTYSWSPATTPATGSIVTGTPALTTTYSVTATDISGGIYNGCAEIGTASITVNPLPIVSSSVSLNTINCGDSVNLFSMPNSGTVVAFSEDFNGATNSWITTNTSTGATPALADWTLQPDAYIYVGTTFHSNDSTQFYMSNSDVLGSGVNTITTLESPSFSTVGLATCNLSFYHYYNYYNTFDTTIVEIFNGTTWATIANYITDQGTASGFVNVTIPLNSYIGLPNVKIRFNYKATYGFYWAIDNVSVFENNDTYTYAWTSTPAGFTSSLQNPTGIFPTVNTTYHVLVTTPVGCFASADTTVIVNAAPAVSVGIDTTICVNTTYTITASTSATSYLWSSGETTSSITVGPYATAGTHSFYVTVTSGSCSNSDSINVIIDPCLGISSSPDFSIIVQPNPTNGLTTIIANGLNGTALMTIYNVNGQLISKENIERIDSRFSKQIDMSTYPKGIYYIKLNNNEKIIVKKIVVN